MKNQLIFHNAIIKLLNNIVLIGNFIFVEGLMATTIDLLVKILKCNDFLPPTDKII